MGINVPGNAVAYNQQLNFTPSIGNRSPKEGPGGISCEVDWGSMGGPDNVVSFNLQQGSGEQTLPFTQIVSLAIDNSLCDADIQFIFTDTATTVTIPGGTPWAVVNVNTRSLSFFLSSPGANAEDITRFQILNYLAPPIVINAEPEQQTAGVDAIDAATAATTMIVPADVDGTLQNISIFFASASGAGGGGNWTLQDGNTPPNIIAKGDATNGTSTLVLNLSGLKIPFVDGLDFIVGAGTSLVGQFTVNAFYSVPKV
jgi:hypothetical protein